MTCFAAKVVRLKCPYRHLARARLKRMCYRCPDCLSTHVSSCIHRLNSSSLLSRLIPYGLLVKWRTTIVTEHEGAWGRMRRRSNKSKGRSTYVTLRSGMQRVRGPPFRGAADVYGTATTRPKGLQRITVRPWTLIPWWWGGPLGVGIILKGEGKME